MSWNYRKTMEFFGIVVFAIFVAVILSISAGSVKVEAQSSNRFQLQAVETWKTNRNVYIRLAAICDTATGTLIYSGGYNGGVWGVPNGCHKNPQ